MESKTTCATCPRYHIDEVDPLRGTCEVSKRKLIDGDREVITGKDINIWNALRSADRLLGTDNLKNYVLCDFHDLTDEQWEAFRRNYGTKQ